MLELDSEEVFSVLIQPVGKVSKKSEIQKFLITQKAKPTPEDLSRCVGTYQIPNGPQVELILENEKLVITSDLFQEPLTPHSSTEFIGGDILRAVRFILDESGSIVKLVVLTGIISDKEIIELDKK